MIAIVDYRAGNLTSVELAVRKLGFDCCVTSESDIILGADSVIFPGVGAAGAAMATIREIGLDSVLRQFAASGRPLLGICLGAQIILETSQENGGTSCLGLLEGTTERFTSPENDPKKIPQIGWNQADFLVSHPVFKDIPTGSEFYFVHSYYPVPSSRECVYAETSYGAARFTSILGRGNIIACQFHPEKSGPRGLQLLNNFCTWQGTP